MNLLYGICSRGGCSFSVSTPGKQRFAPLSRGRINSVSQWEFLSTQWGSIQLRTRYFSRQTKLCLTFLYEFIHNPKDSQNSSKTSFDHCVLRIQLTGFCIFLPLSLMFSTRSGFLVGFSIIYLCQK